MKKVFLKVLQNLQENIDASLLKWLPMNTFFTERLPTNISAYSGMRLSGVCMAGRMCDFLTTSFYSYVKPIVQVSPQ